MPDADVFAALRKILIPHAKRMTVIADTDRVYYLDSKVIFRGKPLFFAAVRRGKAYVSFHLMPIYGCPELRDTLSPGLRKRMQGKSCFNFKSVDAALFKELAAVTKAGAQRFASKDWDPSKGTCD